MSGTRPVSLLPIIPRHARFACLMRRFFLCGLLWFMAPGAPPVHAAPATFQTATEAFKNKDFAAARDAFLATIEAGGKISPDLCFNLANTYFRLDSPGEAALWYRRALLLDPTDTGARQNLRVIRQRVGFHEFQPSTIGWIASRLRHSVWRWIFMATVWSALVVVAALIFLQPRRRGWLWMSLGFLIFVALISGAGFFGRDAFRQSPAAAVIVKPGTQALTAPADTAGVVIDLPPGTEVVIREERETWAYVEIPGERVGWIPKEAATRLWPYSPALIE